MIICITNQEMYTGYGRDFYPIKTRNQQTIGVVTYGLLASIIPASTRCVPSPMRIAMMDARGLTGCGSQQMVCWLRICVRTRSVL